jgi:FSR family fosmidomycin resistance protein-like MFS transporter
MTYLLPLLLGLAHGASDASAGLLVGLIIQQRSPQMNMDILLYNLLAFGLQPLAGLLFDRLQQPRRGAATGLLLTLTGLLLTSQNLGFAILLIGIGSACLHAGGGSVAITSTPGKAAAPGVFAAFGVVGLALGGLASISFSDSARIALVGLLAILAAVIWFRPQLQGRGPQSAGGLQQPVIVILGLLVVAIALRSTVWVGAQMGVARYSSAALWLALAAGSGKLLGGFGADRFGWGRWMLASLCGAGLLLVFASQWLPGLMLGAMLLQSVTPLSIAAVGRALPHFPALAASLALGTAIIAGGLPFFILAGGWFGPAVLAVTLLASTLLYWFALKTPVPVSSG